MMLKAGGVLLLLLGMVDCYISYIISSTARRPKGGELMEGRFT